MPKRSSKHINETALAVVQAATSNEPRKPTTLLVEVTKEERPPIHVNVRVEKNPAAVALGRLGGLKGGKARAEKLSPDKRREIAKKAAQSRWNSKK